MDPEKVKAILEWETPTTVKGARGFIGFANFYRQFIRDFSRIVQPIHNAINRKDRFAFDEEAEKAFQFLKRAFVSAPALVNFDPGRETVVDCDSSGYVTGAALMQYDQAGILHPVAFFSQKMLPAECNYPIHDKELLAIVLALRHWSTELKPLPHFRVRTDHKNLRYFTEHRLLSERQIRWSTELANFNFSIEYLKGTENVLADALSRRDQDLPKNAEDDRIKERVAQLLKPSQFVDTAHVMAIGSGTTTEPTQEELWEEAAQTDETYKGILQAVRSQERTLPTEYRHLKLSIAELEEREGRLIWRDRYWVPESEPLRTSLMQEAHDSPLTGHPGKNLLKGILSRKFFWPGLSSDVARFVQNCHSCGRNTVWRSRKQGLLQPLPIPDRVWSEISMDYITELPITERGNRHVLVITDRLAKGTIWIPVPDLESATLARAMISNYIGHHGLPSAITSDRGEQFVAGIWGHLCAILKINQRLSTAYHPDTDGSTERMNQTLEEYLRHFCGYYQDDWDLWLPIGQVAILARESASTGLSPFFITHGYHPNLGQSITLPEPSASKQRKKETPAQAATALVRKLKECTEFAQAAMAAAQERQRESANQKRDPVERYKAGDKVWLDIRNIKLDPGRKRKLCEQHRQFTVIEPVGANACRLDTPAGLHDVFNNSLLRRAATNPFPSQAQVDYQPSPIIVDDEEWWNVEEILDVRVIKGRGRGSPLKRQFLVRWKGYADPTWEPQEGVKRTIAFREFEKRTGRNFKTEPLKLEVRIAKPRRKEGGNVKDPSRGGSDDVPMGPIRRGGDDVLRKP